MSRIFYRCVDWNRPPGKLHGVKIVASFTDAWIETRKQYRFRPCTPSHLLQMRGLKHFAIFGGVPKQSRIFYRCVDWNIFVWIGNIIGMSRIFYRCVDWNKIPLISINITKGRIFYRCVDWNISSKPDKRSNTVASFTDAWIETGVACLNGMSI